MREKGRINQVLSKIRFASSKYQTNKKYSHKKVVVLLWLLCWKHVAYLRSENRKTSAYSIYIVLFLRYGCCSCSLFLLVSMLRFFDFIFARFYSPLVFFSCCCCSMRMYFIPLFYSISFYIYGWEWI